VISAVENQQLGDGGPDLCEFEPTDQVVASSR
jgi:hypothetical protein